MDVLRADGDARTRSHDQDQEAMQAKRLKTDPEEIFNVFLLDSKKTEMLRRAYNALVEGHSMMSLCIMKLMSTNARISEEFTRASCVTSFHMEGNKVKTFALGSVFMNGLKVLKAFTEKNNSRVPVNDHWRKALAKLLNFMYYDDQSALFELNDPDGNEGVYALGVAQHLLSPLAVGDIYTIDGVYQGLQEHISCPCKKGERLTGNFGDTSFGCKEGWHGKSDILMGDALPVICIGTSDDDLEENLSSSSSTQEISSDIFGEKDISQLTAQTIVFSFLQYKNDKEKMQNFLIPCLGISGKKIITYFYDSVEDVLLATAPVPLEAECHEFNVYAIVFLWMTLNYKVFCTGITEEMQNFKADFFKRVDDCLDIYRNDVIRPCPLNHTPRTKHEEQYGWANCTLPSGAVTVEIEDNDFYQTSKENEL